MLAAISRAKVQAQLAARGMRMASIVNARRRKHTSHFFLKTIVPTLNFFFMVQYLILNYLCTYYILLFLKIRNRLLILVHSKFLLPPQKVSRSILSPPRVKNI